MDIKKDSQQILDGNFNQETFIKEYNQGMSPSQLLYAHDLSSEVSSLLKEKIITSSNKEETLKNNLPNLNKFLLSLTDSDFAFSLKTLKDDLATIPEFSFTSYSREAREAAEASNYSEPISKEGSSQRILAQIGEIIAETIYTNNNLICTDSKREILIKSVTHFYEDYEEEQSFNKKMILK